MNEWTVVIVIISLVGLIVTIVTPIIKLNTSITKLTVMMDNMSESICEVTNKNNSSHERIHKKIDEHEVRISHHDIEIELLKKGV